MKLRPIVPRTVPPQTLLTRIKAHRDVRRDRAHENSIHCRLVTNPEPQTVRTGQAEVIAFLSDPASYGREGCVERIETHANLIFLAGFDAWKIKRAVRFPYLDFSTLDKRHAACVSERSR